MRKDAPQTIQDSLLMQLHPDALYYHVALQAIDQAKIASEEITKGIEFLHSDRAAYEAASQGGLPPIDNATFSRKMAVVTAITFTAMCLEAYINECYALLLPVLFDEVERFQHQSKWMMLPRLLGANHTFDKDARPYQTFAELISTRNNRLVHFKLPSETPGTPPLGKVRQPFNNLIEDIALTEKFVNSVGAMIQKLYELTGGKTHIPKYLSGAKYIVSVRSLAKISTDGESPR
jgi:hypothetical protein